jgi:uncharacterized membrane protein YhaH (DUF805 family)
MPSSGSQNSLFRYFGTFARALHPWSDFRGRSGRIEFLSVWLFSHGLIAVLNGSTFAPVAGRADVNDVIWFSIIFNILSVPLNMGAFIACAWLLFPASAVYVRRMHDLSLSAWWSAVPFLILRGLTGMLYLTMSLFSASNDDQGRVDMLKALLTPALLFESSAFVILAIWPGTKSNNRFSTMATRQNI